MNANQQKGTRFYVRKALEVDATNLTKRIDNNRLPNTPLHSVHETPRPNSQLVHFPMVRTKCTYDLTKNWRKPTHCIRWLEVGTENRGMIPILGVVWCCCSKTEIKYRTPKQNETIKNWLGRLNRFEECGPLACALLFIHMSIRTNICFCSAFQVCFCL